MKATYIEVEGKGISIFKDPKTDNGTKKSAKGLLKVDRVDGKLALFNDVTAEEEQQGMLRPVFKDGTILVKEDFADIRSRLGVI
jgi:nicotinamide phosphoribosyltransferase